MEKCIRCGSSSAPRWLCRWKREGRNAATVRPNREWGRALLQRGQSWKQRTRESSETSTRAAYLPRHTNDKDNTTIVEGAGSPASIAGRVHGRRDPQVHRHTSLVPAGCVVLRSFSRSGHGG